jgi:hypothetical protein
VFLTSPTAEPVTGVAVFRMEEQAIVDAPTEGSPAVADAPVPAVASPTEVEIKFVIVPEGFSHTRRFASTLTLLEVKKHVEEDLRIPLTSMKLVFQGQGAPFAVHVLRLSLFGGVVANSQKLLLPVVRQT